MLFINNGGQYILFPPLAEFSVGLNLSLIKPENIQWYILFILSSLEIEVKWKAPQILMAHIINYPESILLPETGLARISVFRTK